MILLSQDGKNLINFDNVKNIKLNDDYSDKEVNLIAYFTDNTSCVIGTYKGLYKCMGQDIINSIAKDYKGSATIKLNEFDEDL